MTKRGPDHQKVEAKRSLWDQDGQHIPKRYRNKGKGRHKDKKLVRDELDPNLRDDDDEILAEIRREQEQQAALDCYLHGPCAACLAAEEADDTP